jgi:hypothetical protein
MVPRELFPKMSDNDFKMAIESPIQLRVCKILKQLIDSNWSDLDHLTITFLKVYIYIYNLKLTNNCRCLFEVLLTKKAPYTHHCCVLLHSRVTRRHQFL